MLSIRKACTHWKAEAVQGHAQEMREDAGLAGGSMVGREHASVHYRGQEWTVHCSGSHPYSLIYERSYSDTIKVVHTMQKYCVTVYSQFQIGRAHV